MRFRIRVIILCGVVLAGFFPTEARAGGEDVQLWLDQSVSTHVANKLEARAGQSIRFRDDAGTFGGYFVEAGLTHQTLSWLDLGLSYRQVYEKSNGDWFEENRPYADATIHWSWFDIDFSDRNRVEYRDREARDSTVRYRNRIRALFPLRWTDLALRVYLSGEAFFDDQVNRGSRSRVRTTVGMKTAPPPRIRRAIARHENKLKLSPDFYIAYQSTERDGDSVNDYIIGMKLGVAF